MQFACHVDSRTRFPLMVTRTLLLPYEQIRIAPDAGLLHNVVEEFGSSSALHYSSPCELISLQAQVSMNNLSIKSQSLWETSSRLLATLVNEGLVRISVSCTDPDRGLNFKIEARDGHVGTEDDALQFLLVGVHERACSGEEFTDPLLPLSPVDLQPPVVAKLRGTHDPMPCADVEPAALFEMIFLWLDSASEAKTEILRELETSAKFQRKSVLKDPSNRTDSLSRGMAPAEFSQTAALSRQSFCRLGDGYHSRSSDTSSSVSSMLLLDLRANFQVPTDA